MESARLTVLLHRPFGASTGSTKDYNANVGRLLAGREATGGALFEPSQNLIETLQEKGTR